MSETVSESLKVPVAAIGWKTKKIAGYDMVFIVVNWIEGYGQWQKFQCHDTQLSYHRRT